MDCLLNDPELARLILLPPRPQIFIGRQRERATLIAGLRQPQSSWQAITGMPGSGKSALASEVLHQIAAEQDYPGSIVVLSGRGRVGVEGLRSLLQDLLRPFAPQSQEFARDIPDLTALLAQTQALLASKRLLLLLDQIEAGFPWRHAHEALLTTTEAHSIISTSRVSPVAAIVNRRLHLGGLKPSEALQLLERMLPASERHLMERLCEACGYLPLALEAAANAVSNMGIPLALLVEQVSRLQFGQLLDSEQELSSRLEQVLEVLGKTRSQRFALLASLGVSTFSLQSAAALWSQGSDGAPNPADLAQLAETAAELGQLVRHSLLEWVRASRPTASSSWSATEERYQLQPLVRAYARQRLAELEPALRTAAQRRLQVYALAYVRRHRGDVPQLEREQDFLLACLMQAWEQGQDVFVVQVLEGLSYLVGRMSDSAEGERVLRTGIQASRQLQDWQHLAAYLNRLSGLLSTRGQYEQARQVWEESLSASRQAGKPIQLWEPFSSFIYIADLLGRYETAHDFAEGFLQNREQPSDPGVVIVALFVRGYYARLRRDTLAAREDFSHCLRLLAGYAMNEIARPYATFFALAIQAELARLENDYQRSQEVIENALIFAQEFCDPYTTATLLLDQAIFAYQHRKYQDVQVAARRLITFTQTLEASHLRDYGRSLLRHASTSEKAASGGRRQVLTRREQELLQLVAEGRSNREIAVELTITPATVKKHLEHISTKLDAQSRTHAVARARDLQLLL